MSQERDLKELREWFKELREWFRALNPDEIVKFIRTLPEETQGMIRTLAREWANHRRPKALWWQLRLDPAGHRYYQNRQTKETHWASAMTGGSGALDISTGTYHVPLD